MASGPPFTYPLPRPMQPEPAPGSTGSTLASDATASARDGVTERAPAETSLDLLTTGEGLLSPLERLQIRLVRASLRPGVPDRVIRALQRSVGQWWIRTAIARLRHVHGLERLPRWNPCESVVCVANHRSLFDLYVVTAELVANGLPQRLLFPVRSTFFYDHPLGPLVNGLMSFFAMYPPIFREKNRAALNLASLDEVAALLRRGGFFVGLHPEGTRKKDDDPYTLLPPQTGVGRIIRRARVPVVPVFVNGLGNDLARQIAGGLGGGGRPIHVVFGAPIELRDLLEAPESPRTYRRIAERCVEEIARLGQEEKAIRARGRTAGASGQTTRTG
jgi:1-acyl-sn-glycerol-3-phosphate acyltransferase